MEKGLKVTLLSFPGREPGTIGAVVYRLHHDPKSAGLSPLDPAVLQMLHIAAHLDAIKNRILPALAAGQYVVLDRYWWSTLVYGLRGGADAASLKKMIEVEKYTWGAVLPNYVFMLSRPSSANKDVPKLEFDALSKLYRKVAAREGRKYPVAIIGTETSMDRSLHQILKTLDPSAHQLVARDEDCPSPPLFVQNYPPRAEDTGSPPDNECGQSPSPRSDSNSEDGAADSDNCVRYILAVRRRKAGNFFSTFLRVSPALDERSHSSGT